MPSSLEPECMGLRTERNESGWSSVWYYPYLEICILGRNVLPEIRVTVQLNLELSLLPGHFRAPLNH